MITTLDDFVREFTKIKEAGWIKTHRSGPTGLAKRWKICLVFLKIILTSQTSGITS